MKLNPIAVVFWIAVGLICGALFGLNAGLLGAGLAMVFSTALSVMS